MRVMPKAEGHLRRELVDKLDELYGQEAEEGEKDLEELEEENEELRKELERLREQEDDEEELGAEAED